MSCKTWFNIVTFVCAEGNFLQFSFQCFVFCKYIIKRGLNGVELTYCNCKRMFYLFFWIHGWKSFFLEKRFWMASLHVYNSQAAKKNIGIHIVCYNRKGRDTFECIVVFLCLFWMFWRDLNLLANFCTQWNAHYHKW